MAAFKWRQARVWSRRRHTLEQLETRTVLAADCVTCELVDGVLQVAGTVGADSIEIRYDSNSKAVEVLGANELIGRFAADGMREVIIYGNAGDDQFRLSSPLPMPTYLDGGEGEDSLATLAAAHEEHSHGHADEVDHAITALSVEHEDSRNAAIDPEVINDVLPLFAGFSNSVSSSPSLASVAGSAFHNGHEPSHTSAVAVASGTSSNSFHASGPSAGVGTHTTAGNTFASNAHEHAASISATASGMGGLVIAESQTVKADGKVGKFGDGASHHADLAIKQKGSTSYTAKWCTTTPWAKQLVANFAGTAKCKCDAPKGAPGQSSSLAATTQTAVTMFALGGGEAASAAQWAGVQQVLLRALDADGMCSEGSLDQTRKRLECSYEKYARIELAPKVRPTEEIALPSADDTAADSTGTLFLAGTCLLAGSLVLATAFERQTTKRNSSNSDGTPGWLRFEPLGA